MRLILSLVFLLFIAMSSASHAQIITHPKEQIALQLGAIQLGYNSPIVLSAVEPQLVINAIAQGRLSLIATNGLSAVNVIGAKNLPANS